MIKPLYWYVCNEKSKLAFKKHIHKSPVTIVITFIIITIVGLVNHFLTPTRLATRLRLN